PRNQMRPESEDQSQRFDGNTGQDERSSQSRRREKHNRGQHKEPSCQQHQETHDLHSAFPRFKAKRFTLSIATLVKISQSRWNPTRRSNNNKYCLRSPSRGAGRSVTPTIGQNPSLPPHISLCTR